MGKNVSLTSILVFFNLADVTNASLFWNFRKLTALSPKVSPNPSPAPGEKKSSPVGGKEKAKEKQNHLPSPASASAEDKSKDKKAKQDKGLSPPPIDAKDEKKTPKDEVQKKDQGKSDLPTGNNESCDGIEKRCWDTMSMIACIKSSNDASKALVLILNEGNSSLKVDLTASPREQKNVIDIPKHQSKKVNILLGKGGSSEITLNAGYDDCVLHLGAPTSQGNYFQWIPSYSKYMTPVYGAYLVLVTTLIAGGVWGQTDIPYQELEMSMPESAVPTETAEAWDEDWDYDWDEERAVKSPGGPQNISANGPTSRTQNKDGWEDWAD